MLFALAPRVLAMKSRLEPGARVYKVGDYLFEGSASMKYELVHKGHRPKSKTKLDTLVRDGNVLLLGSSDDLLSPIYKRVKIASRFDDFKVDSVYKGKLAAPDFSSDSNSRQFRTRIKEGCKALGVNFAGKYTIIEWGCGCECQLMAIVDRQNGRILFSKIPFDTMDGHCGTKYKLTSRLLIVNTDVMEERKGYREMYRLNPDFRIPSAFSMQDGQLIKID